ncbi:fibronectin type III domain-containing protein [Candidatus Daviesbacteria bacterium]|nr:fibronectin type III domain-containing protein [Candidatus Daviesbacteria bacterium]
MKIPTLIGIALIIALIGSLGYWLLYGGNIIEQSNFKVSDLQTLNISNNTATVVWQTNLPVLGHVLYGESENLNLKSSDNRDIKNPAPRFTHFVTLKNLKPNTRYFYKIVNNSQSYPEKSLEFTTANLRDPDELNFSFIKPVKGTILNTNLNPIDESLIFFSIPGAQDLATFSSTAGNFIMPLKLVLDKDLKKVYNIPDGTPASITVKKQGLESKVQIIISDSTVNLPPVTIGTSLDLSKYAKPSISTILIRSKRQTSFDFNGDGKINSLDLAILREKAAKRNLPRPDDLERFDITSDGAITQEDVDVFSKSLVRN